MYKGAPQFQLTFLFWEDRIGKNWLLQQELIVYEMTINKEVINNYHFSRLQNPVEPLLAF